MTTKLFLAITLSIKCTTLLFAQTDTPYIKLNEIEIIAFKKNTLSPTKPLGTLDQYLEKNSTLSLIRRGAYAYEAQLNGMSADRTLVTIDGMQIYGACTDRMDPSTSYVEISNLAKVNIHQNTSGHTFGNSIAGNLDLETIKPSFGQQLTLIKYLTGFESNGNQRVVGTHLTHQNLNNYTQIGLTYRKANNYYAGNHELVSHSKFTKYNASAKWSYLFRQQQLSISTIYDLAKDVGYPALPMDVSTAQGWINALDYDIQNINKHITKWHNKLYYNTIKHIMDDSQRSDVMIHMDMPGKSKTFGIISEINIKDSKRLWNIQLNAHQNQSFADMTMYAPHNTNEKNMYMLTWPNVFSKEANLSIQNEWKIDSLWRNIFSIGSGLHQNTVKSTEGLESLRIFYPNMDASNLLYLNKITDKIQFQNTRLRAELGITYAERSPSVSEGYGYYLFNSFDKSDYIGNPNLRKERSFGVQTQLTFQHRFFQLQWNASYFEIYDYIIGILHPELSVMTFGSKGVKIYTQIPKAYFINQQLEGNIRLSKSVDVSQQLIFRIGNTNKMGNLPLIQPLTYRSTMRYQNKNILLEIGLEAAQSQKRYGKLFGEPASKSYQIIHLSVGKNFTIQNKTLQTRFGIENVFDKYYSTYADWNRIPRTGRNIYINLTYNY